MIDMLAKLRENTSVIDMLARLSEREAGASSFFSYIEFT